MTFDAQHQDRYCVRNFVEQNTDANQMTSILLKDFISASKIGIEYQQQISGHNVYFLVHPVKLDANGLHKPVDEQVRVLLAVECGVPM